MVIHESELSVGCQNMFDELANARVLNANKHVKMFIVYNSLQIVVLYISCGIIRISKPKNLSEKNHSKKHLVKLKMTNYKKEINILGNWLTCLEVTLLKKMHY